MIEYQAALFTQPQSPIDKIRVLWEQTIEADKLVFLDEVRRRYLFGARKPTPPVRDGQHNRGVA